MGWIIAGAVVAVILILLMTSVKVRFDYSDPRGTPADNKLAFRNAGANSGENQKAEAPRQEG